MRAASQLSRRGSWTSLRDDHDHGLWCGAAPPGRRESETFADASFEAVTCRSVLQHIEHLEQVVAEMRRVLKSGGMISVLDADWASVSIGGAEHRGVVVGTTRALSPSGPQQSLQCLEDDRRQRRWCGRRRCRCRR